MERIEAFEAMLKAALEQSEAERQKMEVSCLRCTGNTA